MRLSSLISALCVLLLAQASAAQTADEVRSDVLAALSTPLPITIVGPLLTRDVTVSEEGDGFRAVLQDTTIMGLFPFGEVSMVLTPIDDDLYRVSDMTFPSRIDIPGLATLTFAGMSIEGTWSARDRSYSDLTWVTEGLTFRLPEGAPGTVGIGRMAFDVLKEPDDTDTESRFEITLGDLAVKGFGPDNLRAGEVRVLLAANGAQPVDLYSLVREAIMRGTMGGGGGDLMTLGRSLLGNTYSVVTLDLTGRDLDIRGAADSGAYLTAGGMTAQVTLSDVEPRDWGGAEIRVALQGIEQRDYVPEMPLVTLGEAAVALRGSELPVADMLTTVGVLSNPPRGRPVPAQLLLDGLLGMGLLELSTDGRNIALEVHDSVWDNGERRYEPLFVTRYDGWTARLALSGLNVDRGALTFAAGLVGGELEPRSAMGPEALRHVEAWFPVSLRSDSTVTSLNEAFLRQVLADVEIADLNEPIELALPMLLYAAASVFDLSSEDGHYETGLFRVEQSGELQFFPTEIASLSPYTGRTEIRMTGMEALQRYFETADLGMRDEEASAVRSVFTVLGNLAVDDGEALSWTIARPDLYRREVVVNDVTLRYPDLLRYLPMLYMGWAL